MQYIQPRPSSIVAALYTARDLGVDLAVLHGPSGCSFKHARLLEEDGMRVLTTSLGDNEFIFGGHDPLVRVLRNADEEFSPRRIAIVGTCVSMIIGEDLESAIHDAKVTTPTIAVDIHAGFRENIDGVLATLEPAAAAGWISDEGWNANAVARQTRSSGSGARQEHRTIAAIPAYIAASLNPWMKARGRDHEREGDRPHVRRRTHRPSTPDRMPRSRISQTWRTAAPEGGRMPPGSCRDAGVRSTELIGALDEYGANGVAVGERIRELAPDFALIVGVPHAIPPEYTSGIEVFSITNGPRQVDPLREIGHRHVIVEIDLHPKTLGAREIVESEFGAVLRSMR